MYAVVRAGTGVAHSAGTAFALAVAAHQPSRGLCWHGGLTRCALAAHGMAVDADNMRNQCAHECSWVHNNVVIVGPCYSLVLVTIAADACMLLRLSRFSFLTGVCAPDAACRPIYLALSGDSRRGQLEMVSQFMHVRTHVSLCFTVAVLLCCAHSSVHTCRFEVLSLSLGVCKGHAGKCWQQITRIAVPARAAPEQLGLAMHFMLQHL